MRVGVCAFMRACVRVYVCMYKVNMRVTECIHLVLVYTFIKYVIFNFYLYFAGSHKCRTCYLGTFITLSQVQGDIGYNLYG